MISDEDEIRRFLSIILVSKYINRDTKSLIFGK